jgi:hypothetical protein
MKHKVFFWLLLKDRVSTRDILRRRNQPLDIYSCELCLRQRLKAPTHSSLLQMQLCNCLLAIDRNFVCQHKTSYTDHKTDQDIPGSSFFSRK